jgi:Fur family ferric uptake transcriptional regulator
MSCITTIKEKGLKLTVQRQLIVDAVHSTEEHLTPEQIIAYVQRMMPGINKSTIYRNLQLLEEAGCIYKSETGGHLIYHHAEEGQHYHLVCKRCGKTIDCTDAVFKQIEEVINDRYGFQAIFNHMVISGLCKDCRGLK